MSPRSTCTFPSREAHNGSAQSNSEDASQVDTQPNDNYYENLDNCSTYLDQTTDSRPTSHSASHTYPQHQQTYYTAALIYPYGNVMYPAEVSAQDVQTPPPRTPTLNGAYLTRDQTYQGNDYITRPHTPVNRQPTKSPSEAWGENRIHTQSSDAHVPTSPPSPQAQRYIEAQTPEERLRLGLPRFQDQQQQIDYYEQQQIDYDAYLNSTGRQ